MSGQLTFALLAILSTSVLGYMQHGKDLYLTDALLRQVVERMGRDLAAAADTYLDSTERGIGENYQRILENEESGYPIDLEGLDPPSLRDREFLQHSSLLGSQFISSEGEGPQHRKPDLGIIAQPMMKTDPTLPAYCNPPNPCPVGYSENDGCLEEFENTAAFSRKFQGAQECMCDTEHMFDCPAHDYGSQDLDISSIMTELDDDEPHKNLVAKKFHTKKASNPYLEGEMLPIAAKKGHTVWNEV